MNGPAQRTQRTGKRRGDGSLQLFDDTDTISPDELRTIKSMIRAYSFGRVFFWALLGLGSSVVAALELYDRFKDIVR